MPTTKENQRPTIRRCADGRSTCFRKLAPSASARSTVGCRNARIRMRGSGPSISPVETRQQASPLTQRRPKFARC